MLIFPPACKADPIFNGPFAVRDLYPLRMLHMTWIASEAQVIDNGAFSASLNSAWANTSCIRKYYRVDAETRYLRPSFTYGILPKTELKTELPLVWRGKGILDPAIDGWHDFFGMPEGGRDKVNDNEYFVGWQYEDGSEFQLTHTGASVGNAIIGLQHMLYSGGGGWPVWSVSFDSSLPTARREFGHSGVDLAAGLRGEFQKNAWKAYWGAAGLYYSEPDTAGLRFERTHAEAFAYLEHSIGEQISLQSGLHWSSRTLKDIPDHPNHSLYVDFGLHIALSNSSSIGLMLRENPSATRGSTDVVFGAEGTIVF
jgi:hypothetical protein